jgi:hypothetical protein
MSVVGNSQNQRIGSERMRKRQISLEEAGLLLDKLIQEAVPVVAFFTSKDGVQVKLRGLVDSVTAEVVLVVAAKQEAVSAGYLSVPIGSPVGTDCKFSYGDKRELPEQMRDKWAEELGEAVLTVVGPDSSRLHLFFTL